MTSVEVAPGVHVLQDGSARGPRLEEALACYSDQLALDDWLKGLDPDERGCKGHEPDPERDEQGVTAYCNGSCRGPYVRNPRSLTTLPGSPKYPDAPDGCRLVLRYWHPLVQGWRSTRPGTFHAHTPQLARRAAADAIRNGRI